MFSHCLIVSKCLKNKELRTQMALWPDDKWFFVEWSLCFGWASHVCWVGKRDTHWITAQVGTLLRPLWCGKIWTKNIVGKGNFFEQWFCHHMFRHFMFVCNGVLGNAVHWDLEEWIIWFAFYTLQGGMSHSCFSSQDTQQGMAEQQSLHGAWIQAFAAGMYLPWSVRSPPDACCRVQSQAPALPLTGVWLDTFLNLRVLGLPSSTLKGWCEQDTA